VFSVVTISFDVLAIALRRHAVASLPFLIWNPRTVEKLQIAVGIVLVAFGVFGLVFRLE
jgi:hypothetical protein